MPRAVYTIGHSTRPIAEFIELLRAHGIEQLVDVRTAPGSRHNPQYCADALAAALADAGVVYVHMRPLGGLRKPRPDSPNTGWRNQSFRGYADSMGSPEFQAALRRLIALAERRPSACMCAEAVPWRCHRSLIGDALVARGVPVIDILSARDARPHALNPMAVVDGELLTYPAGAAGQLELGGGRPRARGT